MPIRDFRTPADPQDFETLFDRAARPPRDFRVTKNAGNTLCIFALQDFTAEPERSPTVSYRAYFVPLSAAAANGLGTLATRLAAAKLGLLCANVASTGRGEWIKLSSPDYATVKGYFLAVGVNRRGVESEPTMAVPSPYN